MKHDSKDKSLRELFEADRRADRAVTPPFAKVLDAERPAHARFSTRARVAVAMAGVAGLAVTLWALRSPGMSPTEHIPESDSTEIAAYTLAPPPVTGGEGDVAASGNDQGAGGAGNRSNSEPRPARTLEAWKPGTADATGDSRGAVYPPPPLAVTGEGHLDTAADLSAEDVDRLSSLGYTSVSGTGIVVGPDSAPAEAPAPGAPETHALQRGATPTAQPVESRRLTRKLTPSEGGLNKDPVRDGVTPTPRDRVAAAAEQLAQEFDEGQRRVDAEIAAAPQVAATPPPARFERDVTFSSGAFANTPAELKGLLPGGTNVTPAQARALEQLRSRVAAMPPEERARLAAGLAELQGAGAERYAPIEESGFKRTMDQPLSTFSVDVDTASYTKARKMLRRNQRPPADSIRIEEWINYFDYDLMPPRGSDPFAVTVEIAGCPWNADHRLARVALQGRQAPRAREAGVNLVFLVDVSGSMNSPDKAPLVQATLREAASHLNAGDRIAIVTYAGDSQVLLPTTPGSDQAGILDAIDSMRTGGSTHGAAGIKTAYDLAQRQFIRGGINRVVLATDGDFNVGTSSASGLIELVEVAARNGIFLTVLGYGSGNLNDALLEALTNRLNGFYAYVDGPAEARRVMGTQLDGSLVTIAKDVKIQVEFNPVEVGAYRLIGYENRALAREDFNDDRKDAGDIGAGHSVTALYELVPPGLERNLSTVDPLRYRQVPDHRMHGAGEAMWVKVRYKDPDGTRSRLIEQPASDNGTPALAASRDFKFAATVAMTAMKLRGSRHVDIDPAELRQWFHEGAGRDDRRREFLMLMDRALALSE